MFRMQNNKTYIVAGLALFSLMGRARQPIQGRPFHPIWVLLCQRYLIAGKPTMRRCWHRQLRFSKKRMLPASSASLIAPL